MAGAVAGRGPGLQRTRPAARGAARSRCVRELRACDDGSNDATSDRPGHGAAITQARPEVFGLGLIIAVAGIAFRQLAFSSLGRFFTTRVTTRADQTVVETGPYRFIRHPSYSGFLMTVLGVLLCETNWLSLACFLLAMPGLAYRIKVEERALLDGLGAPYQDYMRRTWMFVPLLL